MPNTLTFKDPYVLVFGKQYPSEFYRGVTQVLFQFETKESGDDYTPPYDGWRSELGWINVRISPHPDGPSVVNRNSSACSGDTSVAMVRIQVEDEPAEDCIIVSHHDLRNGRCSDEETTNLYKYQGTYHLTIWDGAKEFWRMINLVTEMA